VLVHILGEVGTFYIILLHVYPSTCVRIFFIGIGLYFTDTEHKIGWQSFLRHGVEMSGNGFINPIPSYSHWYISIHIPDCTFNLILFLFTSHSHWLFPFSPVPIPVLLAAYHQITNYQYTCSVKASSVERT